MKSLFLATLLSLPAYKEDIETDRSAQLEAVAESVATEVKDAPVSAKEWGMLLLTIGYQESGYSLRILRGECKKHECDGGRARSWWQLHKNLHTAPVWDKLWGQENIPVQVAAADNMLRRSYWVCARSGVPWLQGTINAYAGRRCAAQWPGLQKRVAVYNRLMLTQVPK